MKYAQSSEEERASSEGLDDLSPKDVDWELWTNWNQTDICISWAPVGAKKYKTLLKNWRGNDWRRCVFY